MSGDPEDVVARYWAERGGKPEPRPRHPLTPAEEHEYLVKGSRLFNRRNFYDGHDEWEEVWRRASGARKRLLHGIIQVAVGYEHLRRGNPTGMASLLRQGAAKLERFADAPGVGELRERALADAQRADHDPDVTLRSCPPPKIMVTLEGHGARGPVDALRIAVPPTARG